jgi:hypothetical protein
VKWLQKKNYQYEVTFALYMLTPTEKFIFSTHPPPHHNVAMSDKNLDSILFLTSSMLTTACVLYLPDHASTVSKRVYYYFAGDAHIGGTASRASEAMFGAASDIAGAAYQAAVNTAAAAQEAVSQAAENLGWT